MAVERLGVGPGTTIQFVAPVLMLLWRRFVQHLAVPSTAWTGAASAVIGVGLVTGAFSAEYADSVGMLAGLGAAFSFAALTIVAERLGKTLHPITYTAYGLTIAALIWAAALPASTPHLSVVGWVGIAWVTIMGMGIPFLLLMSSLRHISPGPAGVAATSEPIVGALGAWVALGQTLSLPPSDGSRTNRSGCGGDATQHPKNPWLLNDPPFWGWVSVWCSCAAPCPAGTGQYRGGLYDDVQWKEGCPPRFAPP